MRIRNPTKSVIFYLSNADLTQANLTNSNRQNACLKGVKFDNTNLLNTNLDYAHFQDTKLESTTQIFPIPYSLFPTFINNLSY